MGINICYKVYAIIYLSIYLVKAEIPIQFFSCESLIRLNKFMKTHVNEALTQTPNTQRIFQASPWEQLEAALHPSWLDLTES